MYPMALRAITHKQGGTGLKRFAPDSFLMRSQVKVVR